MRDTGFGSTLAALVLLALAGCGGAGNDSGSSQGSGGQAGGGEPGGTFTVGDESWTVVPSMQCSIYPGNVVNIAGHAAENPDLEIVIDWGGPNGARIAESDSGPGWHAVRDTLTIEIDGPIVRGSATFSENSFGTGERAEGSFEVRC